MDRQKAAEKINSIYSDRSNMGDIKVLLGGKPVYEINNSSIGAVVNVDATVSMAFGKNPGSILRKLASVIPSKKQFHIAPVVEIDSEKLQAKVSELSAVIDKKPVDAQMAVTGGKPVKKAGVPGYKLNEYNMVQRLKSAVTPGAETIVALEPAGGSELQVLAPKVTITDFNGIDEILSSYSTTVIYPDRLPAIKTAVQAIDGKIVSKEFSFNSCLESAGALIENNEEGYNQVASTLYAALLSAGLPPSAISRVPHKNLQEYIEPGLDARIFGHIEDLAFKNTRPSKLAIFAGVENSSITVYIAGKKEKDDAPGTLRSETVQIFDPPVIYVENRQLKPGEKQTVSAGMEGIKTDVYRDGTFLHSDTYEAVSKVIHIGPETSWQNGNDK